VASFDTGISSLGKGVGLRLLVKVFGYAAERIAKELEAKGGKPVVPPEGFFVEDREGPLKEGELKRASEWAKRIRKNI
jgi:flavodoxin